MKIIPYTKNNTEYDGINFQETRFAIADDNEKIIDNAQGYGYKTKQGAYRAMWYKFQGGKQKMQINEQKRKQFFKEHKGLEKFIYNIFENNFKEIARGEVTDQDILDEIKKEFNVIIPKEYLRD